ncbi:SRPBCC domain-containing protein [Candidatus Micrarchaeota archaeon]|nr:SRPBCC domain-containing protein [Candidatus Micrarchaeota archaeon]
MVKTTTIKQTIEIQRCTPEQVYSVLMNTAKHEKMTGSKAKIDPKVGGKFTAWDGYISGENVELVPGRKIIQKWRTLEWPADAEDSVFQLELFKTKTGTKIVMTHSKVPADQADNYAQGWTDYYWNPMRAYFKN